MKDEELKSEFVAVANLIGLTLKEFNMAIGINISDKTLILAKDGKYTNIDLDQINGVKEDK